jgi:ankyrin repeat protein
VLLIGPLAPKVAAPIFRVMQPINEFIVGGAMSIAAHATGNTKEEPSLIQAIEDSDPKRTQKLLGKGADPNERNSYGYPALSIAAGSGDTTIVKLLLAAGANVNARSVNLNDTALASAAERGHPEIVRLLVQAGADVEAKDGSGWTPLFGAAMSGNSETVKILLDAGADINARASKGWTALKEAEMRGNENIVQQLKSAGAVDFPEGTR